MTQVHIWSALHLKEGCWYIEYGKTICPVEEEDVKATCDKADPRGVKLVPNVVVVLEELTLADLALLPEKERNKILNQRARDAKKADKESTRATAKAMREGTTEKGAKKGEKPGKSKVISLLCCQWETKAHCAQVGQSGETQGQAAGVAESAEKGSEERANLVGD
jgi:hypothetical protein